MNFYDLVIGIEMIDKPREGPACNKLLKLFFARCTIACNKLYNKPIFTGFFDHDICELHAVKLSKKSGIDWMG